MEVHKQVVDSFIEYHCDSCHQPMVPSKTSGHQRQAPPGSQAYWCKRCGKTEYLYRRYPIHKPAYASVNAEVNALAALEAVVRRFARRGEVQQPEVIAALGVVDRARAETQKSAAAAQPVAA